MSARFWSLSLVIAMVFVIGFVSGSKYQMSRRPQPNQDAFSNLAQVAPEGVREKPPVKHERQHFAETPPALVPTPPNRTNQFELAKQRLLEEHRRERDAVYSSVFRSFGLAQNDIEPILENLTQLHHKAINAGDPMGELLLARAKYDRDIKTLLGDELYEQYRDFERGKPFRTEVSNLKEFAGAKKITVDWSHESQLVNLFQEFNLQAVVSWDGPYDPPPVPLVGAEPILANNQSHMSAIQEGMGSLQDSPDWEALPPEIRNLVQSYFDEKLTKLDELNGQLRLSPEQRRAMQENRVRELIGEKDAIIKHRERPLFK